MGMPPIRPNFFGYCSSTWAVLVTGPHRGAPLLGAVVEQLTVLRHRQDSDADAELVHLFEGHLRRPRPVRGAAGGHEVVVYVNRAAADIQLRRPPLAKYADDGTSDAAPAAASVSRNWRLLVMAGLVLARPDHPRGLPGRR